MALLCLLSPLLLCSNNPDSWVLPLSPLTVCETVKVVTVEMFGEVKGFTALLLKRLFTSFSLKSAALSSTCSITAADSGLCYLTIVTSMDLESNWWEGDVLNYLSCSKVIVNSQVVCHVTIIIKYYVLSLSLSLEHHSSSWLQCLMLLQRTRIWGA